MPVEGTHRVRRRQQGGAGDQHLLDAFRAHLGTRNHHEHEGGHHHRHQDLHEIAEKRGERADLHLTGVDAVRAEPQHGDAGNVHHREHQREHQRHQLAEPQGDIGQFSVGHPEPALLVVVPDKRTDHSQPADLLAQDPVDGVEAFLHRPAQGPHPAHDQHDDRAEHRHDHDQQGGQSGILAQCQHNSAQAHDRRGDHQREAHQCQHLDLLDVVRGPGDQRGCAEPADLADGERLHLVEQCRPEITPERHRRLGAEIHGGAGTDDLHSGNPEHDPAGMHNIADVASDHPVVDDVGVQGR